MTPIFAVGGPRGAEGTMSRLFRRDLWVVGLGLTVIAGLAACDDGKKSNNDTCESDDECGSGFCYLTCLDPDGDTDEDGLINSLEKILATLSDSPDTDGDGANDADEVGPDRTAPRDSDGDGLIDAIESSIADADRDCISDQADPTSETHGQLVATHCGAEGVCATAVPTSIVLSCPDGLNGGPPACDLTKVPGFVAVDSACDGVDSNCDGTDDEGFVGAACEISNTFGKCPGTTTCAEGAESCDGPQPAGEVCDGVDQDCDGDTDEETCDDADPCTTDVCLGGDGCENAPKSCDDGDACTTDSCDPASGACINEAVVCDDGDACTDDACDSETGCVVPATSCDDGDACTTDTCDSETGCENAAVSCDDASACTTDTCDSETGCANVAISCDDADACTTDTCDAATGCAYAAVVCDDADACTTDSCDAATGCAYAAVACDDADACTTDSCDAATGCVNADVDCDDADACTIDTCNAATGCGHTSISCDDSDACTTDSCDAATGCVNADVDCDDADACTTDTCNAATGCGHTSISCDDSDACTTDSCDTATGCVNADVDCDDADACTTDTCNAVTGCGHADISCNDSDACTTDSCDTATGCVNADVDCDDSDACTTDTCNAASGCGHTSISCDDSNACTTDSCDTASGCVNADVNCDDGNACTTDSCDTANGCVNAPLSCDDSDACTADSCDTVSGCVNAALDCEDSDACTVNDCDSATGCTTTPLDCDDEDPCTDDLCDGAAGCYQQPTNCDDGDICNGGEACEPGEGCYSVDNSVVSVEGFESEVLGWTTGDLGGSGGEGGGALNLWQITDTSGGGNPVVFDSLAFGTPNTGDQGYEHSFLESPSFDLRHGGVITFRSFVANEDADLYIDSEGGGGTDVESVTGPEVSVTVGPTVTVEVAEPGDGLPPLLIPGTLREGGYDRESFQVSYDGGFSWTTLVGIGDPRWTQQQKWLTFEVRVAADFATVDTRFRFVYDTFDDCCGTGDVAGWFIDDFIVSTSDALVCDDSNGCSTDLCDPVLGCLHQGFSEDSCDDGDVCTQEFCVEWLGCLNFSLADQCDIGTECLAGVCDAEVGCTFVYESTATVDPFDAVGGWTTGVLEEGSPNHWALGTALGGTAQVALDSSAWVNTNGFANLGVENSYLQSPVFNSRGGARVTFTTASESAPYSTEEGGLKTGDLRLVEVSFDGGATWESWRGEGEGELPSGEPQTVELTIGTSEGTANTLVRFVYINHGPSMSGLEVQGWAIDDFSVESPLLYPCDDGLDCTADACVPYYGCTFEDTCDDLDACTSDYCSDEGCIFEPIDCDDGNPCTLDLCDPATGCDYLPAVDCDDENPCSIDGCNPATGACGHDSACGEGVGCEPVTGECLDCGERLRDFDSPALPVNPGPTLCNNLANNTSIQWEGLTLTHSATKGALSGCRSATTDSPGDLYIGATNLDTGSVTITFPVPVTYASFYARDFLNYTTVIGPWNVTVSWEGGSQTFAVPTGNNYELVSLEFASEITSLVFKTSDTTAEGVGISFGLDNLTWTPGAPCPGTFCGDGYCNEDESCSTCPGDCGNCDPGDCCGAIEGVGCSNPQLESCVCAFDAWCCDVGWDDTCAEEVATECGFNCLAECGDGSCDLNGSENCETCPGDCGVCDPCTIVECDAISGCSFSPNPACYTPFSFSATWTEARDFCEEYGGYLVSIRDAKENAFIRDLATSQCDTNDFFIGLTDEIEEGTFVWTDGSPLNYTNWQQGEPSNSNDEDYVEMWSTGTWNDQGVNVSRSCVICEFNGPFGPSVTEF
jgi:hypothetical protein